MKKYLLSKTQKITLIIVSLSYIAYLLYETSSYSLNPEQFFRPYSKIVFVLAITLLLVITKRKNWKTKIKLLTLISTLTFILFNTSLQLSNLFSSGIDSLSWDLAKDTNDNIEFENIEKISNWVSSSVNFQILYRIGKIVLLDIFAFFAFWAINKTIDEIDLQKE